MLQSYAFLRLKKLFCDKNKEYHNQVRPLKAQKNRIRQSLTYIRAGLCVRTCSPIRIYV